MIETFILFLSGFKKGVIDHCEMDKFHATIIGAILLIVGIYATSAWCFFFQTVWSEWYIYLPAGLLLGSFIVCFDRALIASMATASNNKLGGITFRFILAILLGIFLSQPMMLKFFQSDVEIEARALRSEEDSLFQKKLESSYLIKLTPLQTELERLRSEIKESETIYNNAVQGHTGEVQGTSGSGQSGVAKVAKETKETRDKREAELKEKKEELNPEIKKLVSQIDSIYKAKNSDLEKHKEENTISGTLIQAKALKSLITKDESGILT
jgi:hypothetical protein